MSIHDVLAEARRRGEPDHLIQAVPYARTLGLEGAAGPDGLVTRLPFREDLVGNPHLPALHGADHAAVQRSVTLSVDYLRSAGPRDSFARGQVTRQGRRVANVRVEAWQDDPARPFAQAQVHLLITPHSPAAEDG